MRVRFEHDVTISLATSEGPGTHTFLKGEVKDFPDDLAGFYVRSGDAVPVEETEKATAPRAETEKATAPRKRARRSGRKK